MICITILKYEINEVWNKFIPKFWSDRFSEVFHKYVNFGLGYEIRLINSIHHINNG